MEALSTEFIQQACHDRRERLESVPYGLSIYSLFDDSHSQRVYSNLKFKDVLGKDHENGEDNAGQSLLDLVDSHVDPVAHQQLIKFLQDPDCFHLKLETDCGRINDESRWCLVFLRKIKVQGSLLAVLSLRAEKNIKNLSQKNLQNLARHNDLMAQESFRAFTDSIKGFLLSDYMLKAIRRPLSIPPSISPTSAIRNATSRDG